MFTKLTCSISQRFQSSLVKLLELMKALEQLSDLNFPLYDNFCFFPNFSCLKKLDKTGSIVS